MFCDDGCSKLGQDSTKTGFSLVERLSATEQKTKKWTFTIRTKGSSRGKHDNIFIASSCIFFYWFRYFEIMGKEGKLSRQDYKQGIKVGSENNDIYSMVW